MIRYLISIVITCAFSGNLFAQAERVEEYKLQQEQLKKTALLRELDSGVYYMDLGNYTSADEKFQYVLDNVKSVPSDLTFFFGKNSFHLGRYKQSIDWLNKYIQLKGTNGQYSSEAVSWMRKAEAEFVKEKSQASEQAAEVLSTNYDIDCGPSGKVTCPVCKGDHVIIKKGAFGPAYKTCSYCNEHGWLTCDEYNQLLRGELQQKN
jgi:tetratricopeptide (TPR) repeat protein